MLYSKAIESLLNGYYPLQYVRKKNIVSLLDNNRYRNLVTYRHNCSFEEKITKYLKFEIFSQSYAMHESRYKGIALIINNNNFKEGPREGSDKDIQNVGHVFNEIGYKVVARKNLKANVSQMTAIVIQH